MYILCIFYVHMFGVLSEKDLCLALLPSNVQCLQLARQAWLGLGQTLPVAPQICMHKISQVKEMLAFTRLKPSGLAAVTLFASLQSLFLISLYISPYLLLQCLACVALSSFFLTLKLVSHRTVLRPVCWISQPELWEEMGTTKALKTVGSCVAWYRQWYQCDISLDACDTFRWHRITHIKLQTAWSILNNPTIYYGGTIVVPSLAILPLLRLLSASGVPSYGQAFLFQMMGDKALWEIYPCFAPNLLDGSQRKVYVHI